MSRERPILFSAPMVRAILAGTKTQTRRMVKGIPLLWLSQSVGFTPEFVALPDNDACPYGEPGDRLWVRETFYHEPADYVREASVSIPSRPAITVYRADGGFDADQFDAGCKWQPSIHMPRNLSRITLEITGVRVERLQDISEADARAEGIVHSTRFGGYHTEDGRHFHAADPRQSYASLWEQINGPGSWDANPWVWVLEFRRLEKKG